jgi:hypothetical protein
VSVSFCLLMVVPSKLTVPSYADNWEIAQFLAIHDPTKSPVGRAQGAQI